MASPFQQQARQRKLIYFGLILVLFTAAYLWRTNAVTTQAERLALRESARGDVELTGSVVRLLLTGSRGLATCGLWMSVLDKQKKNQWSELEVLVRQVSKLQPHFITPWLFQSWNLAYNVSVGTDRVNDKYYYITRGVQLLAEGERQNRNNPDLRYWIGFYTQHKICKSDETNVQRSLFQLSLIPPNERDPARFKLINPETNREEINFTELEDFCKTHPQLVRRLREGMIRDTLGDARRQFTCATADDVVRFLTDNQRVASPFEEPPAVAVGQWQKRDDKLRPLPDCFPPLPPDPQKEPRPHLYSENELNADQIDQLGDDVDAYAVARSWWCYAQEPIPDPDRLPGSTQEITDRATQRKPKQITCLIFRNHPALAQSSVAERLQQEGWFDNEPWLIRGWFPNDQFARPGVGRPEPAKVGNDRVKWSQEAWANAYDRWRRHGEMNHLLFESEAQKANIENMAADFGKTFDIPAGSGRPPRMRTENMDDYTKECYFATQYLFELKFYRDVSNFTAHLNRSFVDSQEDAVLARKGFHQAERLRYEGSTEALKKYAATFPIWRDRVLLKNKDYRRLYFIMEDSYDWEYRYLRLYHEQRAKADKQQLGILARAIPLVPAVDPDVFTGYILQGPLDGTDDEGFPLIDDDTRAHTLLRRPKPPQGCLPHRSKPVASPNFD
jgi:hypothetical protein